MLEHAPTHTPGRNKGLFCRTQSLLPDSGQVLPQHTFQVSPPSVPLVSLCVPSSPHLVLFKESIVFRVILALPCATRPNTNFPYTPCQRDPLPPAQVSISVYSIPAGVEYIPSPLVVKIRRIHVRIPGPFPPYLDGVCPLKFRLLVLSRTLPVSYFFLYVYSSEQRLRPWKAQ